MMPVSKLDNADYHLFKRGVLPKWEDPVCRGRWIISVDKLKAKALDGIWTQMCLWLASGAFTEGYDEEEFLTDGGAFVGSGDAGEGVKIRGDEGSCSAVNALRPEDWEDDGVGVLSPVLAASSVAGNLSRAVRGAGAGGVLSEAQAVRDARPWPASLPRAADLYMVGTAPVHSGLGRAAGAAHNNAQHAGQHAGQQHNTAHNTTSKPSVSGGSPRDFEGDPQNAELESTREARAVREFRGAMESPGNFGGPVDPARVVGLNTALLSDASAGEEKPDEKPDAEENPVAMMNASTLIEAASRDATVCGGVVSVRSRATKVSVWLSVDGTGSASLAGDVRTGSAHRGFDQHSAGAEGPTSWPPPLGSAAAASSHGAASKFAPASRTGGKAGRGGAGAGGVQAGVDAEQAASALAQRALYAQDAALEEEERRILFVGRRFRRFLRNMVCGAGAERGGDGGAVGTTAGTDGKANGAAAAVTGRKGDIPERKLREIAFEEFGSGRILYRLPVATAESRSVQAEKDAATALSAPLGKAVQ